MCIRDSYDVTPTQGQFDALICFSYNFGTGWMSGTSDLVKIARGEKDATRLEAVSYTHLCVIDNSLFCSLVFNWAGFS